MKKRAIIHNLIAAFSNYAFVFLTGVILLPFYFKYITSSDYGTWLGGISLLSLASVLEANISLILTQQLGEKWTNRKKRDFAKYWSAAQIFGLCISSVIVTITFFIRNPLCNWINVPVNQTYLFSTSFLLYAISLCLTILTGYILTVTQVFLKTLVPPFLNIIASACGIIYTVLAVKSQGILGIAAGNMIRALIYFLLAFMFTKRMLVKNEVPFLVDFSYITKLIQSISLPFVSKVLLTASMNLQNFIVATFISATATTVFDITRKLPMMIVLVINMVGVATFTSFSLLYSEAGNDIIVKKYTRHFFSFIKGVLLLALSSIFIIGEGIISIWVGSDKFGGNLLLGLICLTAFLDQLRGTLSQQYYAIGKFRLTAIADSVFATAFILSALVMIPELKLYGIVLAGLLANLIYFGVCKFIEFKFNADLLGYIWSKGFYLDLFTISLLAASSKWLYHYSRIGAIIITLSAILIYTFLRERETLYFLRDNLVKPNKSL